MFEQLLTPKNVAVVGASAKQGKVGYEILHNLVSGGFEGDIVGVNPGTKEILGIPCYCRLADYKGTIDLSVIAVPRDHVLESVQDSISCGARAVVVITAGFKETDEEGARLESEIAALCKDRGVQLLGPNCLGVINTHHKLNASFASHMPVPSGVSVISQSGALCTAILDWAVYRKLGLAKMISMGNKADLTETDLLKALADDKKTKVVVGYLESITAGDRFISVAENVSSKKPVILFKSGVTDAGMVAASSHTGSLAGTDISYGAAFRRSGVIRAETFEALLDYGMAFAMQPLPKGNRVAIITNAGGPGIMAADAVELSGMRVSALETHHAAAIRDKLPGAASVGNPIDVLGDADPHRYEEAVRIALDDDTIDAVVVILTPQAMTKPTETARAIADCATRAISDGAQRDKPIVVSFMGGSDVEDGREELLRSNIPDYPSPERAVDALRAMWDYAAWLNRPVRVLTRFPVNRKRVKRIINRHQRSRQLQLGEASAKSILKAYGFTVPDGGLAVTADDAVAAAQKIGYPVAMKIASPAVVHKSDVGGVRLNLASDDQVRDAFDLMMLRIGRRLSSHELDGVYVEKMCHRGREVILGMTRDPQFGPMLMFGLGGIFVEVMKDVTFNIAPITRDEAMQMLRSTKSFSLLKGTRGEAEVDLNAIATSLQRISQMVTEFPQIVEMDINPFVVGKVGQPSIAADARITLADPEPAVSSEER